MATAPLPPANTDGPRPGEASVAAAGPDYGRDVSIGAAGEVWLAGGLDTGADGRDVWVGRFTP